MKFTTIISVAIALCVVSTNAAPVSTTKVSGSKATTTPTPPPKARDPCADLAAQGKNSDSILKFNTVRDCYRAQTFKPEVAEKILTSVESAIGNFYAFIDNAKEAHGAPFKTPRVDLLAELKKIRRTKWKNDYDFNMALTYLTFSANDGHLAYRSDCYHTAKFLQPISLYAPVVNDVQNIRVFFADDTQEGVPKTALTDCIVTEIDGVPALKAVQDFADRTSAISKDPGVRLNDALASTSWYNEWLISPGGFASRWEVPKKNSMDYTIQCASGAPQKLTVPWIVKPADAFEFHTFRDTKTYWDVQCAAPLSPYNNRLSRTANNATTQGLNYRVNEVPATTLFRERGRIQLPGGGKNGRVGPIQVISKAKEILLTATTAFYRINKSNACVAVIASEEAAYYKFDPSDYLQFIEGLEKLRDGGCKKLILDMTNNGGGSVDFAYFINQVFFPKAKPYFVEDLRSNKYVQGAAKIAVKQSNPRSVFDARGYVSMATNKVYTDDSMFTKGVNMKRGGVTQTYSQKNYFEYGWPFMPMAKNRTLPWKASDMAIVTNGFCGSACTMIATRFNIVHKVKTYAVGGVHKRPLSYFSFPGGFVMDNESLTNDIKQLNYKAKGGPSNLVTKSTLNVAVGEIYATETSKVPLEYDTKYFPANVHLDQDPVSARNPDNIWMKIVADFK
ncbi:hypothetical protein BCR41DRAFT_383968 [Lobosporangium transversale]|uniref:Tail specific protease domain-containing protein n=1 Tax=Lobosporangium transversale TaxID=64571 RepID=A0A1Y2GXB6_9FUNG|nr:hypothetical protein BCR41DRAFT_383968 [Lobosporangium transversale]ORZ26905.1 hypothetical protein BCR41DRAFT_383968 [Lobosporangium transversale]|eukprot:XP_021884652.1 hypothetical protein BCR41DRAFT_383968 [Lobosporangium transversale]